MEERTTMNGAKRIWNYLRSGKTGKEAQRLERMALNDPFLYEALEGLESVDGEHEQVVEKLCRSLTHPPRKRIFFYWAAAVAAILGGVASGVLLRPAEPLPLASVTLLSDTLEREMPLMVYQDSAKSAYGNNAKELLDYSDAADFSGQEEEEAERPCPVRLLARADQAIPKGAGGAEEVQDKRQQVETLKKAMPLAVHAPVIGDTVAPPKPAASASARQDTLPTVRRKRQKRREVSLIEQQGKLRTDWMEEFRHYVSDSLRYPETARDKGVEGVVVLSVHLNKHYRPSRIKVVRKLSPACDREARRLVEEYPGLWNTGVRDFTVSVTFSLEDRP